MQLWKAALALTGFVCGALAYEPPAGTEIVWPADASIMVYVPAGEFVMGLDEADIETVARDLGFADPGRLWAWEALPKRTLHLPGYFIDRAEVTVEQWRRFVTATGRAPGPRETARHFGQPGRELLPAAEMDWAAADAYAVWAGKRLPSEAQWEKAARGTDGRMYPWGNAPPTAEHGHFQSREPKGGPRLYTWVGRYPQGASPYGALDMLGNQYEWTRDRNLPYPGNSEAARMDDYADGMTVLRGGSWYHGWVGYYAAKRFGLRPEETYFHVGFRTVWEPPEDYFASPAFAAARAAVPARLAELAALTRAAEDLERAGGIKHAR